MIWPAFEPVTCGVSYVSAEPAKPEQPVAAAEYIQMDSSTSGMDTTVHYTRVTNGPTAAAAVTIGL